MGNYILKNDETIFRCNNWAMEVFQAHLKDVIESQNLQNNERLTEFLDKLDQDIYGRGIVYVEVLDYFDDDKNKLPIKLLYSLVVQTIEKIKITYVDDTELIRLLEQFKENILSTLEHN